MTTEKYQGWTNYETWAANLWLTNEEGSYNYWNDKAQEFLDEAFDADESKEDASYALRDYLESEFEEAIPEVPGLWADLLRASFQEINWQEIAESLLEDKEPTNASE